MSVEITNVTATDGKTVRISWHIYGRELTMPTFSFYVRHKNGTQYFWQYTYQLPYNTNDLAGSNTLNNLWSLYCDEDWDFMLEVEGDNSDGYIKHIGFYNGCQSDYMSPHRPTQQSQNVVYNGIYQGEAGTCVANTLASIKEIQEIKNGKDVYKYSVGWFYGLAGDGTTEELQFLTGLNRLKNIGIPPYQIINNNFGVVGYPDIFFQPDAKSVYNQQPEQGDFALAQKISGYNKLTDYQSIMTAIKTNGVMMCGVIDKALDDAKYDGIMGELTGIKRIGHAMILLGWTTMSGKKYWIAQNSWCFSNGSPMGDDGLYYIPFSCCVYGYGFDQFYEVIDDPNAPPLPPIPSDLKPPYITGYEECGVSLAWDTLTGAEKYELQLKDENGWLAHREVTGTSYTYRDLKCGFRYWFSIRAFKNGLWTAYTTETKAIIRPYTPEIKYVLSTTNDNLIVTLDEKQAKDRYTGFKISRYNVDGNTSIDSKINYTVGGSSEWTGLTTGTKFEFDTQCFVDLTEGRLWSIYVSSRKSGVVGSKRPSTFSWTYPKIKGQDFKLTAKEWNDLCNNINQMLIYKGKTTKQFTQAITGNDFKADHWNECKNAIRNDLGYPSYIATHWQGDSVLASDMNLIVDCLNSIV